MSDRSYKKRYPGPPGWRLGVGLQPLSIKIHLMRSSKIGNRMEITKTKEHGREELEK